MYISLMPDLIGINADATYTLALARDHGFDGVDLRIAEQVDPIERHGVSRLADELAAARLSPGYCSLLTRNLSADAVTWAAAMQSLPRVARIAQALGYTRTATVVLPFSDAPDYRHAFSGLVSRVREALPVLRDHGIRLGLEYVSPVTRRAGHSWPFVHTLREMLEVIDACGPGVGVMLDSFHWHCAGESTADLRGLDREHVVVVHLNDAIAGRPLDEQRVDERELPGDSGVIDLGEFLTSLAAIGYDGPLTAEPTHPRWRRTSPVEACRLTSHAMRHTLEDAGISRESHA